MQWHWLSCVRFTVGVGEEEGIIRVCPPLIRRFIGQPLCNLKNWMLKLDKKADFKELPSEKDL